MRRLIPIADILLRTISEGVTTADLIEYGTEAGVLKGTETAKDLSALGHVFRAAGGENSGTTRCSKRDGQKSVRQVVWTKPRRKPIPSM